MANRFSGAANVDAASTKPHPLATIGGFLATNLAWVLSLVIFIVGSTTIKAFLYPANLRNILLHSTVVATLAIGTGVCLITGFFDMAQEAILILSATVAAWLCSSSSFASGWMLPVPIAILASLALAVALGALQGICITKLGMVPFITSLSLRIALLGIVLVILRQGSIAVLPASYRWLGVGQIGPLPAAIIVVLLLYMGIHWVLISTSLGRSVFAVGGNRQSAKNAGINDERIILYAFMLSGFAAGVAGWITAGRLNAANYQMSVNVTFEVIAASVLGGISMGGGRGNLLKAVSGVLVMTLIVNFLNLRHLDPWFVDLARGILIFTATVLDSRTRRI